MLINNILIFNSFYRFNYYIIYLWGKLTLSDIGISSNNLFNSLQDLENIISKFNKKKRIVLMQYPSMLSNINLVSGNKQ